MFQRVARGTLKDADLKAFLEKCLVRYGVAGCSAAVLQPDGVGGARIATVVGGFGCRVRRTPVYSSTWFELASLSKPIAAAFAIKYLGERGIGLERPVNGLLADVGSSFALRSGEGCPANWADEVTVGHLLDHTALGMHYVRGVPRWVEFPAVSSLLSGSPTSPAPHGYAPLDVIKAPGSAFNYSGGGFLVLQHVLETMEGRPIAAIVDDDLARAGGDVVAAGLSFDGARDVDGTPYADGYDDAGKAVPGGRLNFPPLAAGAVGSPSGLAAWLRDLAQAHGSPRGSGTVTHAVAAAMLDDTRDLGAYKFMKARMGRGVFVLQPREHRTRVSKSCASNISSGDDLIFNRGEPVARDLADAPERRASRDVRARPSSTPTQVFDVRSDGGGEPNRWMLHQAANDGFRGLFLVCFDGPDAEAGPKGFVLLCNGDNNGMLLNCAVARELLKSPVAFPEPIQGLDWSRVPDLERGFDTAGLKQEEIVNLGLRDLVLDAFVDADS